MGVSSQSTILQKKGFSLLIGPRGPGGDQVGLRNSLGPTVGVTTQTLLMEVPKDTASNPAPGSSIANLHSASGSSLTKSNSVVSSLSERQSKQTESSASIALLRFVRSSFPTLPLETMFDMLLGGPQGKPTFSHRTFTLNGTYGPAFEAGRREFIANTLDTLKPFNSTPLNHPQIRVVADEIGGDPPKYTSKSYASVEIDSLLKVPTPADTQWDLGCDGSSGFFTIRSSSPLSPSRASSTPTPVSQELWGPGSSNTPPPSPLDPGFQSMSNSSPTTPSAFKRVGDGSGGGGGCQSSSKRPSPSYSDNHYPEGSNMYIVGETQLSLGSREGNEQYLVQKLLQAERNVCFLTAKEGKGVEECILGVIFFSSKMTKTFSAKLAMALKYYKDSLPCLWRVCELSRLMGCTLQDTHHAAPILHLEVKMERLESSINARLDQLGGRVDRLEVKVDGLGIKVDELGTKFDELGAKLDRLLAANNKCCSIV